jgi:hypothetical protein
MRTSILLLLVALIAGCAADGTPSPTGAPPAAPVLVIVTGDPGGPGRIVAEALTHGPTDDIVNVTGALFVDADGTVRLCDAIAESFPPQCGGARIEVTGLDLDTIELQEANGIRWAEGVTLRGSVE